MNYIQSEAHTQNEKILGDVKDGRNTVRISRTFDQSRNKILHSNIGSANDRYLGTGHRLAAMTEVTTLPKLISNHVEMQTNEYSASKVPRTVCAPLHTGVVVSDYAQRSNSLSVINGQELIQNDNSTVRRIVDTDAHRDHPKAFIPIAPPGLYTERQRGSLANHGDQTDSTQPNKALVLSSVKECTKPCTTLAKNIMDAIKHHSGTQSSSSNQQSEVYSSESRKSGDDDTYMLNSTGRAQQQMSVVQQQQYPSSPTNSCQSKSNSPVTVSLLQSIAKIDKLIDLLMDEGKLRETILERERSEMNVVCRVMDIMLHDVIRPLVLALEQNERTRRSKTFSQENSERGCIRLMERRGFLTAAIETENSMRLHQLRISAYGIGGDNEGNNDILERLIKQKKARQALAETESLEVHVEGRYDNNRVICDITHQTLDQSQSLENVISSKALTPIPPIITRPIITFEKNRNGAINHESISFGMVRPILLLESHNRRLVVEEQQYFFQARFIENFREEFDKLKIIMERSNHLERLKYFRNQREKKDQATSANLQIVRELNILQVLQTTQREKIKKTQTTDFATIQGAYIFEGLALERKHVEYLETKIRQELIVPSCASDLLIYLEIFEQIQREHLTSVVMVEMVQVPLQRQADIVDNLLQHHQRLISCVIKIQTYFRKLRIGIIGWRRTHRNIGAVILNMRSKHAFLKVFTPIDALRMNLYELECQADYAMCTRDERQCKRLMTEERKIRILKIEDDEKWCRNRISSSKKADMMLDVLLPQRRRLEFSQEPDERSRIRDALFGVEGLWGELKLRFDKIFRLLERKRRLVLVLEPEARYLMELEEANSLSRLKVEFIDGGKRVNDRQREYEIILLSSRESLLRLEEVYREEIVKNKNNSVVSLVNNLHRLIMDCTAVDIGYMNNITIPYWTETLGVFQKHAIDLHNLVGGDTLVVYTDWLFWIRKLSIYGELEPFNRSKIFEEEQHNIRHVQAIHTNYLLDIVQRQRKTQEAAIKIQCFLRDVKKGGLVGQSGMRAYLHKAMLQKREQIAFRKHIERQREDLERVRQDLYDEIRRHAKETYKEFIPFFERLATLEQRCRMRIDDEAIFLKDLVYRNHQTFAEELIRSQLQNCSAHEMYWRGRLEEEFFLPFNKSIAGKDAMLPSGVMRGAFARKKATFVEDVKIRPAQRAWRCYKSRHLRRDIAVKCLINLQVTETSTRLQIEMNCVSERALSRIIGATLFFEYVNCTIMKLFNHHCFDIELEQGIYAQEAHGRLRIIEIFEGTQRYSQIEREEKVIRAVMYDHTWVHLMGVTEIVETESCDRKSIIREYYLFLMKCTIALEARSRVAFIMGEVFYFQMGKMIFGNEELSRVGLVKTELHQRGEIVLSGILEVHAVHLEEKNNREKLVIEEHESNTRIMMEDRRAAHYTFFINLLVYKEGLERSMLLTQEECNALGDIIYPTHEAVCRERILKRWGSTGPYYERDAVFDLVEGDL